MSNRCKRGGIRRGGGSLVAVCLVLLGATWTGQAAPRVVREIVIENEGGGPIDRGFVLTHAGIELGEELDLAEVSRDVRALLDTRRFSSVDIHAEELADGVRLIYALRQRRVLAEPLTVRGNEHFRDSKIRDWIDLEPGAFIDDQILAVRTRRVVEEYRKDYYPEARVSWTLSDTSKRDLLAAARVEIEEGRRARVKDVAFHGNRAVSSRELGKVAREGAWWNPFGWFGGRVYDPDEFRMIRLDLRDLYVARGYLDATVGEPVVESADDGDLTVRFSIAEGPLYRFRHVDVTGVTELSQARLEAAISCEAGQPAAGDKIRETIATIENAYGQRGYADTRVRPLITPHRAQAVVDVTFEVEEGTLTTIRNIQIQGNNRTRDKVIRRELLVYPGEIYDAVKVRRSERRLMNLGFFSSVRAFDAPTRLTSQRDLVVEVEEKRTGQLMLGAGFSSVDRLVGFVELSQGNFDLTGWPYFTGAGQKLRVRAQFGTTRQRYELSFTEPWFLDRRLSVGFDLYRSDYEYDDYDLERTGGAINIGKSLPGPNRINFRYQLENIDVYNFADTNRYVFADDPDREYFFAEETETTESSLRATLSHDTRNNPFFPSRGNKVNLFASVSGGPLGFDTEVYRLGWRSWHYMPLWFGHVLSLRARYEIVDEYGDTEEMPITSRLFLGGGRTLRGFDYRDVGPKVIRDVAAAGGGTTFYSRPHGGRSLAMASLEYSIPLFAKVRMAGFYDTGNAWIDPFELELDDLAASYGVGIRLDIPGFPIRVDRAWISERDDPFTGEDPWVVWIGYDI